MKTIFLLYIFILSSVCTAQSTEVFHANMEQSIQTEKALVGYQLDQLSKANTKVPVHNHISNLKWLAKTQVPQYLTEKSAIKLNQGAFGAKAVSSNLFHYAITMAGIGASTAIIDDYAKTGEVHLDKSLDFLSDSNFLKNSMGIFIGSTAFSVLGNFLPPGIGPILKTVPGFLGAAVGLNVASGEEINWPKVLVSSLASSAAFVALGSGGILAIGAGIAASMVSDAIFDNLTKSMGDKKEIHTYKPNDPFQIQSNDVPQYKDHKINFKESADPQKQRQLIQEIQTTASENDTLKTKALLESLDNFGQIR